MESQRDANNDRHTKGVFGSGFTMGSQATLAAAAPVDSRCKVSAVTGRACRAMEVVGKLRYR